jgi:hypothetical protein
MRLSSFRLLTAASLTTSQAFVNNIKDKEEDKFDPSAIYSSRYHHQSSEDVNRYVLSNHYQQQKDAVSMMMAPSPSSSSRRRRLLNKGNFMIGQQQQARQGRIDADVGVLSIRPHAQYLHPHQRLVEEDESPFNASNITTPFDVLYYAFCIYRNCTCSNINWAEQTMEAVCELTYNHCSSAISFCAAENGNPTN